MSLESVIAEINAAHNQNQARREKAKRKREDREVLEAILQTHMDDESPMEATILKSVKGGYLVSLDAMPKTRAFLPSSLGKLHGVSAPSLAESFEVHVKEYDDSSIVVSALEWLKSEITRRQRVWAYEHDHQVFQGEIVYYMPGRFIQSFPTGKYLVRIGETEEGIKVAGRLSETYAPALAIGDTVEVVIACVMTQGIKLDISPALRQKLNEEREKKATQYPKGYKPPRRPEAKDAPDPIPTMGSKMLKQYLEDLLEFNQHLPENIQHSLEKRGDWLTKDLLHGNADWYSVYKKLVARDKARSSKAEDLSTLAQEGMTVGEFKVAVRQ